MCRHVPAGDLPPPPLPSGLQLFAQPARPANDPSTADVTTFQATVGEHAPFHGTEFGSHPASLSLNNDGSMTFTGTELLAPVEIPPANGANPALVPPGSVLAYVPANPRFVDGSRLGNFLANYDQFALEDVEIYYVPSASFTTAASLVMAFVNDTADAVTLESGFTSLKDYAARVGAAQFDAKSPAKAHIGHPLLKWYYTGGALDAVTEYPGAIIVANMLDIVNSTSSTIPLGFIYMRYRVKVRSPALDTDSVTQGVVTRTATLTWNQAVTAGTLVAPTTAQSGMPVNLTALDYVYWGTVHSVSDDGGPAFRTWRDGFNNAIANISPGNVLFWRNFVDGGGVVTSRFYPTLSAAVSAAGSGEYAWLYTSNVTAGTTRGIRLYAISGALLNPGNG